jgi:mono/diheme cytochrome c family protein
MSLFKHAIIAGLLLLLGLGYQNTQAQSTWNSVYNLLQAKCASCHTGATPMGGLNLGGTSAEVYDALVGITPNNAAAAAKGQKLVRKGYPYRSFLMRKIGQDGFVHAQDGGLLDADEGAYMPAYGSTETLTNAERELVRQWITAGAPETGSPVNTNVINEYYSTGGLPQIERPEAPAPNEGFQIHLGPIFIAADNEKEYGVKYDPELPDNIEAKSFDLKMNTQSHHFILYKWGNGAAAGAAEGLREVTLFTNNPFLENNELVAVWQYSEHQRLPAGTAVFWDENSVLDLNLHIANYSATQIMPSDVYINVYTQPAGTALKEMKSELLFYQGTAAIPGFFTIPGYANNYILQEPVNNGQQWNIWTLSPHTHSRGVDFDVFYLNPDNQTPGEQIFEGSENGVFDWSHPKIERYEPFIELAPNAGLFHRAAFTNPSPAAVSFGLTTDNEMMITIIQYTEGNPIPFVGIPLIENQYCYNGDALNFVPTGGVASGNGVSGGQFVPSLAGEGTHHVTYTYMYNGSPIVAEYDITVLPPLAAPSINNSNGNLSIPNTYDTFQWLLNGLPIDGATLANYNPTTDGVYSVAVSLNGCVSVSETVDIITGIESLDNRISFLASPNPYSDQINLQYTLKEAAHVQISLYNAMGQRVAIIADTHATLGTHAQRFNAAHLPNGIYYLQLSVGNETIGKKIEKF